MNNKSSILLIYTGGTIGMREDPVSGALTPYDFSHLMSEVPELGKFAVKIDHFTFDPLIDSSDVEPGMWQKAAQLIYDRYDMYDGFVILHGTDTMAYSASALSFMLEGLGKPVIFTGSQLPIGRPRTDGKENLISSVEIASAKDEDGRPKVPEVCIFFGAKLLRGNRSTKIDSMDFDAFLSPNFPPLATAGINIKYNPLIHFTSQKTLSLHTAMDTRVAIIKIHPGITEMVARELLCSSVTRAVIMETYGSGNSISRPWFVDIVARACRSGKIVLNVTQCLRGEVNMDLYATGLALKDAGVVCGADMTTEAALSKLFVLMGEYESNDEVKRQLTRNMRGEITL